MADEKKKPPVNSEETKNPDSILGWTEIYKALDPSKIKKDFKELFNLD